MNWWLITAGAILIFDTLIILTRSNINIGVVLPSVLGAPLFVYGCFYNSLYEFFSQGFGAVLKSILLTAYILYLSITVVCVIVIALNGHRSVKLGADAVIVLGAAVHGSKISLTLKNRLDLALNYVLNGENNKTVIVVSGAKGRQEDISEARASFHYLVGKGFPESKILLEEQAKNTYENFLFSKALLDEHFKDKSYTCVFVTNNFHVYRSTIAAKNAGLDIKGIGCKAKLYIQPNNYLRESLAVLKYWFLGAK